MLNIRRRLISSKKLNFLKNTTCCLHNNTYTRKTPHEHVLLRPDMYVGQMEPYADDVWVPNQNFKFDEKNFLEKKKIKIFCCIIKII